MQALIGQLYFTVWTAGIKSLLWSKFMAGKLLPRTFWIMVMLSIWPMFLVTKIKPQFWTLLMHIDYQQTFCHMISLREYAFSLDMQACRFASSNNCKLNKRQHYSVTPVKYAWLTLIFTSSLSSTLSHLSNSTCQFRTVFNGATTKTRCILMSSWVMRVWTRATTLETKDKRINTNHQKQAWQQSVALPSGHENQHTLYLIVWTVQYIPRTNTKKFANLATLKSLSLKLQGQKLWTISFIYA